MYIDNNGYICDMESHEYIDVTKEVYLELRCMDASTPCKRISWTEMGSQYSDRGQWIAEGEEGFIIAEEV